MEQYIPKSEVVAEIKRRIKAIPRDETDKRLKAVYGNEAFVLMDLLSSVDDIEAKEVDLEKEVANWWDSHYKDQHYPFEKLSGHYILNTTVIELAKRFFELGLKMQKGE